jgi:hypothetical protein
MPATQLSASNPSPKRKREQRPYVPPVNTTLRTASTPSPHGSPTPSGAESPRNAVADQFRGMSIAAIPIMPLSPLTPTDDIMRKKPKLGLKRDDSGTSEDNTDVETTSWEKSSISDSIAVRSPQADASTEIPETPQAPPAQADIQPRIFAGIIEFAQPTVFSSQPAQCMGDGPRPSGQVSKSKAVALQSRSRSESPSVSSLTWKNSEITGHLADPSTDPDDDGTGLNGIGFKPTPALAYARAQRRRQQVLDWRAREAREARAKRNERRKRGVGRTAHSSREGTVERETTIKEADAAGRAVRFAI